MHSEAQGTTKTAVNDAPVPVTVLFVDDDTFITESIRLSLRRWRYQVLVANSGAEGLAILGANPFDIVVCDEHTPGEFPGRGAGL